MASDSRQIEFKDVKFCIPFALLDELRSIPTSSDARLFCKDYSDNDTVLSVNHTKDEYLTVAFPGTTVTWNETEDSIIASIQNFRRQEKRKRNVKSARQLLGLDQKVEETIEEDVSKKPEEAYDVPRPAYAGKKRGRKPKGYYEELARQKAEEAANGENAEKADMAEEENVIPDLPETPIKFNYHGTVEVDSINISVEDIITGRSPSKDPDLGPRKTRHQRKSSILPSMMFDEASPVVDGRTAVLQDPKMIEVLNGVTPTEVLDEHFEVVTDKENRRSGLKCNHCKEEFPTRKEFLIHLKSHVNFTPWHCPLCSYRVHHKSLLAKHLNIHADVKSFTCEVCGQGFSFKEKLQNHMKYHTDERDYSCPHCDMAFHEYKTLSSHIATIHKEEEVPSDTADHDDDPNYVAEPRIIGRKRGRKPKYCGTHKTLKKTLEFRNGNLKVEALEGDVPQTEIKDTVLISESKGDKVLYTEKKPVNYVLLIDNYCTVTFDDGFRRYNCNECKEVFRKKMPFLQHLRLKHRTAKPFKCASCDYVARSKPNVFTHMKIHSSLKEHVCQLCGRAFHFGYKLVLHMKYHNNEREFKCDLCNSSFNNKIDVRKHKERIHTTGRPYLCDICGKGFKYTLAYKRHKMTHIPGKREMCVYCNKPYKSKQSLRIHMQSHTTIFQCQICDKNINSYTAFVAHKNMHDPNYVGFPCKECGKVLQTKTNLEKHLATAHSDARPFKCDTCGKAFKIIEHLKLHMITHETVKKFQCTICGYTMKRKSSLVTHMRRHLHSNPFVCEECGKWFQEKAEYQNHLTTHSGENASWCPFCDRTFATPLVLEKHIESAHTGEQLNIESVTMETIANVVSDLGSVIVEGEHSQDNQLFLCEQCNAAFESQEILAMHILTDHMKQHLDQTQDGQIVPSIKTETLTDGNGKIVTVQNYSIIGDMKVEELSLEDIVNTVEINTDAIPVSDGAMPLRSMIIQDMADEPVVVQVDDVSHFFMSNVGSETVITEEQNEDNVAAQVITEQAQLE